jgi:hypothetical protein
MYVYYIICMQYKHLYINLFKVAYIICNHLDWM